MLQKTDEMACMLTGYLLISGIVFEVDPLREPLYNGLFIDENKLIERKLFL